jgi:hypothetical protein
MESAMNDLRLFVAGMMLVTIAPGPLFGQSPSTRGSNQLPIEYREQVDSLSRKLNRVIRDILDDRANELEASAVPDFYRAVRVRHDEQWKYILLRSEIVDYGTSERDGRRLETIVLKFTVFDQNRATHEDGLYCRVVGMIFSDNLEMLHEPMESICDGVSERLLQWETANNFESRWNLRPTP